MFQKIFLLLLLFIGLHAEGHGVFLSDVRLFYDTNASLDISDITQQNFEQDTTPNFALGYKHGDVWLRFSITNETAEDRHVLSVGETFYEEADLYYFDENKKLIKKEHSLFTLLNKREVATNRLAFEVHLPQNTEHVFYLKLHGKYAYFGNLTIQTQKDFYAKALFSINTLYFLIFGIILAIIIFNLFLFSYVREKIYLYYIGYAFFNFLYIANISGLLVFLDLQHYTYSLHLSAAFTIGFLILFSCEYLNTKKYMPKIDKPLKYIALLFFILGILVVFSYQPWNKLINNFAGLICVVLIVISTRIYFKGHTKTKYYIFAMLLYFTFIVLFTFMVVGLFEYNTLTRYGYVIATGIETMIFSLILSNRYNELKNETELILEKRVAQRTHEIKKLVDEKELLLREIHHRVKNNFHMISGLLWFEEQKNPLGADAFQNIKSRIKSMSMIHEKLYKSKNISDISLHEYLEEIIDNLLSTNTEIPIKLEKEIQEIVLDFEQALALGIILNEVISNSIKHNRDRESLQLHVSVIKQNAHIFLVVKDNGKGFSQPIQSDGVGMSLIESFSHSLSEAHYDFSIENGTLFSLEFRAETRERDAS